MREGTRSKAARQACACVVLLLAGTAWAAGGHHAVDDAFLLDRGECEQESWIARGGGSRVLHAGLQCRVGPVELGGATEHEREDGGSATSWELEVKWARPVGDAWSVGAVLQPRWQAHQRPRHAATGFAALATWSLGPRLHLHFNAGRDFVRGGADQPRGGLAVEWSPLARWRLMAERYLEQETHQLRAGVRWTDGQRWTLDWSRSQRLSGPAPSQWILGLTIALDAP